MTPRVVPASEEYVRPPLVAREPGSRRAAMWRVRIIGAVLAVVGLLVLVWLLLTVSGVTNGEDPGLGGLQVPGISWLAPAP